MSAYLLCFYGLCMFTVGFMLFIQLQRHNRIIVAHEFALMFVAIFLAPIILILTVFQEYRYRRLFKRAIANSN